MTNLAWIYTIVKALRQAKKDDGKVDMLELLDIVLLLYEDIENEKKVQIEQKKEQEKI